MEFKSKTVPTTTAAAAAAAVSLTAALYYFRYYRSRATTPVVTQLFVYPIKSCSGMQVECLPLTPYGVQYDREWALFRKNKNNAFCSQRDFPMLKRIRAVLAGVSGGGLCLRVSVITDVVSMTEDLSVKPLLVPISRNVDASEKTVEIDVWGLSGRVEDAGPEAASWFSERLGEPVFLGRMHPEHRRDPTTMPRHGSFVPRGTTINLQDATALHICTEESFAYLQRALKEPTMEVHRFRPNVVVRNVPFPTEDTWKSFLFRRPEWQPPAADEYEEAQRAKQPIVMETVVECETLKLTSRCSMPTIDAKGERTPGYQPTKFLTDTRSLEARGGSSKPMFGLSVVFAKPEMVQTAIVGGKEDHQGVGHGTELRLGDEVLVTATQPSPWK